MISQAIDAVAPTASINRSGSISLLKGRAASLRRREGFKHASKANTQTSGAPINLAAAHDSEEAWTQRLLSMDKDPMVSYAVTITANNPAGKPKEKRKMLGRILHMKSSSRTQVIPEIVTVRQNNARAHARSPRHDDDVDTGTGIRRNHSRSMSASSFFGTDGMMPNIAAEIDASLWSMVPAGRPGQSRQQQEQQRSSPMSKYNTNQPEATKPRQLSLDEFKRKESLPLPKPRLKVITQAAQSTTTNTNTLLINPFAARQLHPPRKSSLQDASVMLKPSVEVLEEDAQVSPRDRSLNRTYQPSPTSSSHQPPEPPPKDSDKGYTTHPSSFKQKGILDVAGVGPLDRFSVMLQDALSVQTKIQSSMLVSHSLPSPRLRRPLQSTLASRRHGVPKTLHIVAVKGSSNSKSKDLISVVVTPVPAPRSAKRSPAIGRAITTNSPKPRVIGATAVAVSLVHARPTTKSRTRAPDNGSATPSRRRSGAYAGQPGSSGSGQRQTRKKSVHKRRPTGFRLAGSERRRSRGSDVRSSGAIPSVPVIGDKVALQPTGQRQSPITQTQERGQARAKPTGLTPPQVQGEWTWTNNGDAKGRRQPSPLRNTAAAPEVRKVGGLPEATEQMRAGNAASNGTSHVRNRSRSVVRPEMGTFPRPEHYEVQAGNPSATRPVVKRPAPFRSPSLPAMLPLAMHPYSSADVGPKEGMDAAASRQVNAPAASDPQVPPQSRQTPSGPTYKVTAEESIKRMMNKQREQQEQLNAMLVSTARRPSQTIAE